MKKIIIYILIVLSFQSFSQEAPKVLLKDSSQLKLTSLNVSVEITGNFATTTYDMKFYNELNRTLEGELAFPLGEGQAVSGFAMDVNGKIREAVIVEKELARVAFENTVRQNIDPGLLEKTEGNNYKARVYPILPKKYKQIIITHEQELFTSNNFHIYELPLSISENLDTFSVSINIVGKERLPSIKNNIYKNAIFKENDTGFHFEFEKQNYTPNKSILVQISNSSSNDEILTYNDYFYIYKTLKPNSRLKAKPKKITLLWDCSYSLRNRKLEEELKLLEQYFNYLQNVEVQFISFSNAIHQNKILSVNNGKWKEIEQLIKNINYDGGTSFNLFDDLNIKSKEILLFTDGLNNLGGFTRFNKGVIYTINSNVSANHETLNTIATNSGGNYVNLLRLSYAEAFKVLKQETYQFLGVTHGDSVHEVYPYKNTNVTFNFSITGRFSEDTEIELLFGYQGKITERIQVPIYKSKESKLVKRLWAKQKLKFLNENKEINKKDILSLAKEYQLVTDYTSMLILDRIEDYIRYKIEPPQELKHEYKQGIKDLEEKEEHKQDALKERKEYLFEDYEYIQDWYKTKYPKKEKKKVEKTDSIISNTEIVQTETNQTVSDTALVSEAQYTTPGTNTRNLLIDSSKRIISGKVLDEDGLSLPGTSIVIKGTNEGTTSDMDGNFVINAKTGDELVFSFVGFAMQSSIIENSNTLNISMHAETLRMDEVIVTAMGFSTEKKMLSSAVTEVISYSLAGSVSGVSITGESSSVTMRGNSQMPNAKPLFVVDGIVTTDDPTKDLNPEDIDAVHVLNSEHATKLYGSRANNGLIIVTTKNGKEANIEAINELNNKISEKIELKSWNPDTPYIKILEKESTVELAYDKYMEIRHEYSNIPSFYLDVADFFDKRNSPITAIKILTNLIEIELNNHELMKALAYKLEYFKQYDLASIVYKKILDLRPEEPQSYRDLALAYEKIGKIQESFDLLFKLYNGDLLEKDEEEFYYGIEHVAYVELNRLVTKYGKELKLSEAQISNLSEIDLDIRIVIDWNHNDTDIDLWVIEPNGEKAYYKNTETKIGGLMSEDLTEGYGPEEYMLKKAINGEYKILVDYYSDNVQKISGPTILKVSLFTNYGRKNEIKKTIIVRLDKEEDEIEIGKLSFGINK